MPKTKRSHQDNCKQRVCAVCWRKCLRTARPSEVLLIQEYVTSNYMTTNDHIVRRIALISAIDQPTFEQALPSSIRRVSSGDNKELQLRTIGKPTSVTLDVQEQTKMILSFKLAIKSKWSWVYPSDSSSAF